MALKKNITLDNGITLTYHRIATIQKITNKSIIIEVNSYIDETQREKEKEYYESTDPEKQMSVFINATYVERDYDETSEIKDDYEYLKTTDMFKDAEDA